MRFNFSPVKLKSTILAIESSCDDTSVSIYQNGNILANVTATQTVHDKWGGVVPEIASREHQNNILPTVNLALNKSGLSLQNIEIIAYTQGPGLAGSLLVGANFAKGLALGLNVPLIGINHIQAHIASIFIENENISFPCVCLLVSGGHTQLFTIHANLMVELLGSTLDDAAGEAFDKGAKILNLGYPGGPLIDKLAKDGNALFHKFPINNSPNFNFSFSGVKTSLLYYLQAQNKEFITQNLSHICASYQHAIVQSLLLKTKQAVQDFKPKSIAIVGGVSANSVLRESMLHIANQNNISFYCPSITYCTDNAAMIAVTASMSVIPNFTTSLSEPIFTKWK